MESTNTVDQSSQSGQDSTSDASTNGVTSTEIVWSSTETVSETTDSKSTQTIDQSTATEPDSTPTFVSTSNAISDSGSTEGFSVTASQLTSVVTRSSESMSTFAATST